MSTSLDGCDSMDGIGLEVRVGMTCRAILAGTAFPMDTAAVAESAIDALITMFRDYSVSSNRRMASGNREEFLSIFSPPAQQCIYWNSSYNGHGKGAFCESKDATPCLYFLMRSILVLFCGILFLNLVSISGSWISSP